MASQREQFIQQIAPYAQQASKQLGIPASVIIAQLGIESADGTSNPAKGYNNYGGIMENKYMDFRGKQSTQGTYFAGYNSIQSFFNDYVRVLNQGMYANVRNAATVEDTVKALAASPYDAGHYGGSGNSILSYINSSNLKKYDNPTSGGGSSVSVNAGDLQGLKGVPGVIIVTGLTAIALAALMPSSGK